MTAHLVLFACMHNAGRSQIASAFFIELTGRMLTELTFLVTLGCAERCPTIRDEIRSLVTRLVHEKRWA
jgi:hypothetical protein